MANPLNELPLKRHPREHPSVLFLVTEDWYFLSHRLGLARAALAAGYRVVVGTRCNEQAAEIAAEGFEVIDIPFERSLRSPARDFAALRAVRRLLHEVDPDVVHLVAMKPLLLGALAVWGKSELPVVCAFTGLGYIFSSKDTLARLIRPIVLLLLRRLAQRRMSVVLTQNAADQHTLLAAGVGARARSRLIRGSGIDLQAYRYTPPPSTTTPLVLLPARLLEDKGVYEFVAAARTLKAKFPQARFVLAGASDRDNPAAIAPDEIEGWIAEGVIEWLGHRADMAAVYAAANIVCLPSYREGLPKVLLEAAACGRALVATDVAGCRDVCVHEQTGLLVPPRNTGALVEALESLLFDSARQQTFGCAARAHVEAHFALSIISRETLALYAEIASWQRA